MCPRSLLLFSGACLPCSRTLWLTSTQCILHFFWRIVPGEMMLVAVISTKTAGKSIAHLYRIKSSRGFCNSFYLMQLIIEEVFIFKISHRLLVL